MLTIVMYHYVRDPEGTQFPGIKSVTTAGFDEQLEKICQRYTVCGPAEVAAAVRGEASLPENPCMLTFDDGFVDHYLTVFPKLVERGLVGCFFPSAGPTEENFVLDVHKIHFIMAGTNDHHALASHVLNLVDGYRNDFDIPGESELRSDFAREGRLDPPEVMLVKGILQRGLPDEVREEVLDQAFADYVGTDEAVFSKQLYMDAAQLKCMAQQNMAIGGHGYRHIRLDSLPREEQREEIRLSEDFLTNIYGRKPQDWVMCFPWGTYNDTTLDLLKTTGCALGMAYGGRPVLDLTQPLEMTRIDIADMDL